MEVEVSCIQQKEPGAEKVGHINTLISPLSEVANDANFLRKCWGTSTPPPPELYGDQILQRRLLLHVPISGQDRFGCPELSG